MILYRPLHSVSLVKNNDLFISRQTQSLDYIVLPTNNRRDQIIPGCYMLKVPAGQ